MARQIAISALTAKLTAPDDDDLLVLVSGGVTYKITWETLMSAVTEAIQGAYDAVDSAGNPFSTSAGTTSFDYGGAGPTGDDVTTITNVQAGVTRVQTFTYADNALDQISAWVVQ